MATKWHNLKGNIKWAKVYEPDEYSGQKRWMLSFYPYDEGEWAKFKAMGTQLETKEDEDGKFVVFRRPATKLIKEELVVFSPPEITGAIEVKYVDENGNRVRSYNKGDKIKVSREGEPVKIGNGSLGLVNLAVYDVKIGGEAGKGHRLENIKIIDLVAYEEDAPKPPVEEKPAVVETKKADLDDAIPW